MKAEYDLSKMKSRRNPYASKLKKPVTLAQVKAHPILSKMALVKRSRISVVPVTAEELALVLDLAGTKR